MLAIAMATCSVAARSGVEQSVPSGPERRHDATLKIDGAGISQVQVRLARGKLTARGSDSSEMHLRVIQHSSSVDPRLVAMRTSRESGVLRIVPRHPAPHLGSPHECVMSDPELGDFWHYDVTVDIELSVPRGVHVQASTMKGSIDISDLDGDVDVTTNDGNIRLSGVPRELKAAALGTVDVHLDHDFSRAPGARRVSVYGGDVRLWIPRDAYVRVGQATPVTLTTSEIEAARAEGAEGLDIPVRVAAASVPILIELRRGRLLLLPASSSPVRR
jgi:hypothetical protein